MFYICIFSNKLDLFGATCLIITLCVYVDKMSNGLMFFDKKTFFHSLGSNFFVKNEVKRCSENSFRYRHWKTFKNILLVRLICYHISWLVAIHDCRLHYLLLLPHFCQDPHFRYFMFVADRHTHTHTQAEREREGEASSCHPLRSRCLLADWSRCQNFNSLRSSFLSGFIRPTDLGPVL